MDYSVLRPTKAEQGKSRRNKANESCENRITVKIRRVPIIDVSRGVAGVAGKVNKQKT